MTPSTLAHKAYRAKRDSALSNSPFQIRGVILKDSWTGQWKLALLQNSIPYCTIEIKNRKEALSLLQACGVKEAKSNEYFFEAPKITLQLNPSQIPY